MKIGLGLYREQLVPENFRFARQAGATLIVAHLTNYFRGRDPSLSTGTAADGWGDCSTDACTAPWHAGMAFVLGYMRALVQNAAALGPSQSLTAPLAAQ
jgi:hypothetical protein